MRRTDVNIVPELVFGSYTNHAMTKSTCFPVPESAYSSVMSCGRVQHEAFDLVGRTIHFAFYSLLLGQAHGQILRSTPWLLGVILDPPTTAFSVDLQCRPEGCLEALLLVLCDNEAPDAHQTLGFVAATVLSGSTSLDDFGWEQLGVRNMEQGSLGEVQKPGERAEGGCVVGRSHPGLVLGRRGPVCSDEDLGRVLDLLEERCASVLSAGGIGRVVAAASGGACGGGGVVLAQPLVLYRQGITGGSCEGPEVGRRVEEG